VTIAENSESPKRPPSRDGLYPRCVWCGGENYVLAVIPYSNREVPCAAFVSCGRMLPEHYVKGDD
jgi:hypothetical protein